MKINTSLLLVQILFSYQWKFILLVICHLFSRVLVSTNPILTVTAVAFTNDSISIMNQINIIFKL